MTILSRISRTLPQSYSMQVFECDNISLFATSKPIVAKDVTRSRPVLVKLYIYWFAAAEDDDAGNCGGITYKIQRAHHQDNGVTSFRDFTLNLLDFILIFMLHLTPCPTDEVEEAFWRHRGAIRSFAEEAIGDESLLSAPGRRSRADAPGMEMVFVAKVFPVGHRALGGGRGWEDVRDSVLKKIAWGRYRDAPVKYELLKGDCVICLEAFGEDDQAAVMPCSHVFHEDCLAESLKVSNRCPVCRRRVMQLQMIPID